jgi:hypothetical protein
MDDESKKKKKKKKRKGKAHADRTTVYVFYLYGAMNVHHVREMEESCGGQWLVGWLRTSSRSHGYVRTLSFRTQGALALKRMLLYK